MRAPVRVITLLALASAAGLSGCGSDDGAADGGGTVTIYSGRTQDLIEPILDRFTDETGISVEARYGDTADLALLIGEEGDQSPADVFLSQSPGAVGYLDQQGLLGTLPGDVLGLVAEGFHARDGSWVGFSGRKRVLVYNPEIIDESELPDSVLDLVEPEWKGRLGVAPSNASFQDFVTAMRFKLGDDATREWLQGIAENDAFTFANNSAIVAAVGRGEIEVGLVNHYYVYQALAEDPQFAGVNYSFPDDDIGSLVIVTGASMLKSTDSQDQAVELIRFLLEDEAQRYFSDQTYEYPLATGVEPSSVLPAIELRASADIDLDQLGGDLQTTRAMISDAGLQG
ncbi:MAG TPA: iron ABC transporter substrate-binding protein [Ilumatobacteraceae bacterium]|nr:iron ABC transporter substrate-binding protein [Ilumatobacteraceae bacterium]